MSDIPIGAIIMFSGSVIPDGWLLCDGNKGTPDLKNKFILSGDIADIGSKNNKSFESDTDKNDLKVIQPSDTVTVDIDITINEHILTEEEMPVHFHGQGDLYDADYGFASGHWVDNSKGQWINGGSVGATTSPRYAPQTGNKGGGKGHSHNALADKTLTAHQHNVDIAPPYYVLAFIIYAGE